MCSAPGKKVPVPSAVHRIAAGRDVTAVWINEVGGVTFAIGSGTEFVKTATPQWAAHLAGEAPRLNWAGRFVVVPDVLGADDGWLHTAGLPGRSAVDSRWLVEPRIAARAIGAGLRTLHGGLPVAECPFDWSVQTRLAELSQPHRAGLTEPPAIDHLVVCHGDACAPNTLIDDDGQFFGHVDLGDLGVADRWADLAVATLSLGWNYGRGPWQSDLFDAYGVASDPLRIDYYRRLWQAGDVTSQ
jgi:kanamycin kinase